MLSQHPNVTMLPQYAAVEIEGHQFPVLKSCDKDFGNGEDDIVIQAILQLTPAQFSEVQPLLEQETINIKREGIDSLPIRTRHLGSQWWSKHEADGVTYYKQRINLVPAAVPAPPRPTGHWRRNVGMLADDPSVQEVFDEVLRAIEADRSP